MPDQLPGFNFKVVVDGIQEAQFTECSGFEVKIDVEEYKEGGLNDYVHKLPGRQSYSNITLKRGMLNSIELWDWLHRLATTSPKAEQKKNMSVVLYNGKGEEQLRWNLIKAYPIKWTSPSMQSDQSSILIESLELAFQEFTLVRQ